MKCLRIAASLLIFSAASFAQDSADLTTPPAKAADAKSAAEVKEVEKTPPLIKETIITAGGFLVELKRAENKKQFLSLRQKADPVKDTENLWREPKSGRPMGFRLFSLNF